MANTFFRFKQFTVHHDRCAMKVTTDSCFFGAWVANELKHAAIKNALDVGTGTGLLSLMVAQKNDIPIDAVEIDGDAAQQAIENIEASPWANKVNVVNEDILSFHPGKKYDCIISNPPFYQNELVSGVRRKNLAHHSERLTLLQLLGYIRTHLKENGLFFLLVPFKRKGEIEELMERNALHVLDLVLLSQSVNHAPFRVLIKGSNKRTEKVKSISISVWDEQQQYTAAFTALLKDYYLYL